MADSDSDGGDDSDGGGGGWTGSRNCLRRHIAYSDK